MRELRQVERGRPALKHDGFFESSQVVAYRTRVLVLSLTWLQVLSGQLIEPRVFRTLASLVGLVQLVDDLLDWKEDWAHRRPSYVTGFLGERRPSFDRFRSMLAVSPDWTPEAAPLTLAGILVWFLAIALLKSHVLYERMVQPIAIA
jgi:hypothetical protein